MVMTLTQNGAPSWNFQAKLTQNASPLGISRRSTISTLWNLTKQYATPQLVILLFNAMQTNLLVNGGPLSGKRL